MGVRAATDTSPMAPCRPYPTPWAGRGCRGTHSTPADGNPNDPGQQRVHNSCSTGNPRRFASFTSSSRDIVSRPS